MKKLFYQIEYWRRLYWVYKTRRQVKTGIKTQEEAMREFYRKFPSLPRS